MLSETYTYGFLGFRTRGTDIVETELCWLRLVFVIIYEMDALMGFVLCVALPNLFFGIYYINSSVVKTL